MARTETLPPTFEVSVPVCRPRLRRSGRTERSPLRQAPQCARRTPLCRPATGRRTCTVLGGLNLQQQHLRRRAPRTRASRGGDKHNIVPAKAASAKVQRLRRGARNARAHTHHQREQVRHIPCQPEEVHGGCAVPRRGGRPARERRRSGRGLQISGATRTNEQRSRRNACL